MFVVQPRRVIRPEYVYLIWYTSKTTAAASDAVGALPPSLSTLHFLVFSLLCFLFISRARLRAQPRARSPRGTSRAAWCTRP